MVSTSSTTGWDGSATGRDGSATGGACSSGTGQPQRSSAGSAETKSDFAVPAADFAYGETGRVAEDVRVAPVQLRDQVGGDVLDVEAAGLRGDLRVEVDLQQQVAELLAQVLEVTGVDGLERLVGLLEEVAGERAVRLLALPGALGAQPAHHRQELQQRLAGCRWGHEWSGGQSRQTWLPGSESV